MAEKRDYICKYCNKQFSNRKDLWRHLNAKKTSCVSKEKVEELMQKANIHETQITYFEKKTQSLEEYLKEKDEELERVKQELLLIKNEQSIKTLVDSKFETLGNQIISKIDETTGNSKFISAQNQYIFNNNNTNNKIDLNIEQRRGNFFDLELNEDGKERLDHLSTKIMMKVLSAENFPKSMAKLIASIYFHPKAPENHKWCVSDTTIANGALQYSSETGMLYTANTHDTICKNVRNIMFGVTDILTELSHKKAFTENQAINYNRIVNSMGNELTDLCINEIKEAAYEHRQFAKAAWNYMNIPVEAKFVSAQQKLTYK